MTSVKTRRALAVVLLSSALISACGLKPEVKDQLAQSGGVRGGAGAGIGGEEFVDEGAGLDEFAEGDGLALEGGEGGEGGGGEIDPATGQPVGAGGGGGGAAGPQQQQQGGGGGGGGTQQQSGPGTRTGIDDAKKVIRIALHGPLTGAGVPQDSFRTGTPKYWQGRKLANGYTVEAVAIDDKYAADQAARACAAAADQYFLVIGGAGTDQIQACAQQAKMQRGNVPYLSAGVTEAGLGNLRNYFATSLTYRQQGPLVVRMAKEKGFFPGQWAIVATEGPNFNDAVQGVQGALQQAGAPVKVIRTPKAPNNCAQYAQQIKAAPRPDTIYFLGQPAFFAQCVQAINDPTYSPTYTGVGPSFGINSIANLACTGAAASGSQYKGWYLHPATGLDQAGARAPGVKFQDDIEYQIYGAMAGIEHAFNLVQGELTREKFIATLAAADIPEKIAPGAVYRGGSRFGGTKAFALNANCGSRQYETKGEYGK